MKSRLIIFLGIILLTQSAIGQSTAQWRGPNRNGLYLENGLLKTWPEAGPEMLWLNEDIGNGYSSVSVTHDRIFVNGRIDTVEVISALTLEGKKIWETAYGKAPYRTYKEARSTPAVEDGRVYVISGRGDVVCLNSNSGQIAWSVDAFSKFAGKHANWEVAESPLIVDDKVIYTPGGNTTTVVALDKTTGNTVWQSPSLKDSTAYASPILIERGGRKIIISVTSHYIFGIDATQGDLLWSFDYYGVDTPEWHANAPIINCNSPVYHDGRIFVTSGYNHTSVMLDLSEDGKSVKMAWKNPDLDVHHGHVVHVNGYIYGANWIDNRNGNWVCLDWKTGKTMYETEWQNKGSIISAEGMLYCYDEKRGNLALIPASPDGFNIISSFQIKEGRGPHWAHPVIKDGILYMRHGSAVMAFDIRENAM